MTDLDPLAFTGQFAGHIHQAPEVARQKTGRFAGSDVGGFLLDDRVGDIGIFDAECSTETAADLCLIHFRQ